LASLSSGVQGGDGGIANPARFTPLKGRAAQLGRPVDLRDFRLQNADAVEEVVERPSQRIWEIHLIQVDARAHALAVARGYAAGHADYDRAWRHLSDDHRAGADAAVRPDGEGSEDSGAGTDDDIVPQSRVPLLLLEARAAECHPMEQRDVLPYFSGLAGGGDGEVTAASSPR
jgi:hypothetical protein